MDVISTGAIGDGDILDTVAIQDAINSVHAKGGGHVVFPSGKNYLSGTINLLSNVHLTFEPGARLIASTNPLDFANSHSNCLIEASGAENIGLHGFGTVDGRGRDFIEEDLGTIFLPKKWRIGMINFIKCQKVTFRDISLYDSPWWTVHLIGCEDVLIHGIHIINDLKMPNCDGIDPDHCRNVRISDCNIRCADDCVVIKNTAAHIELGPSENITVANCTLMCTATAVKIGTESVCDIRNITVTGCTIENASRGLGIQLRDQGNVENIIFTACTVETRLFDDWYWGKSEPVHISARHRYPIESNETLPDWNPENKLGIIENVIVSDIICKGENGIFIFGEKPEYIKNISLRGIDLHIRKWTKWPGGAYDLRPCRSVPDDPSGRHGTIIKGKETPDVFEHPWSGVSLQNATEINLQNITVKWYGELPDYYHHALQGKNIKGLRLRDFYGQSPCADKYGAIDLDDDCTPERKINNE